MTVATWGRGLLLWGLLACAIAATPMLLLQVLPAEAGGGFFGLIAIMLGLSVVPFAAVVASAGAILLLVAALQRGRP